MNLINKDISNIIIPLHSKFDSSDAFKLTKFNELVKNHIDDIHSLIKRRSNNGKYNTVIKFTLINSSEEYSLQEQKMIIDLCIKYLTDEELYICNLNEDKAVTSSNGNKYYNLDISWDHLSSINKGS